MPTTTETERRHSLFLAVDHLREVRDAWAQTDTPYLTADFEEAIEDLLVLFGDGMIPAKCRELQARVDKLAAEWRHWNEQAAGRPDLAVPENRFWHALEFVFSTRKAAERAPRRTLESIEELTHQKVPDAQICRIYGWVDDEGRPELDKLREERRTPGTHVGPDFVPPHARRDQERADEQQKALERIRQRTEKKLQRIRTPAPEGLEKLVADGVSARQIGRMMRWPVERVFEECEKAGLPRPQTDYADVRTARAPQEPEMAEEVSRGFEADVQGRQRVQVEDYEEPDTPGDVDDGPIAAGEPMTLEQEIIYYHRQGLKPKDIAEALSNEETKVTTQKVTGILSRFERDPEAFADAADTAN